MDENDLLKYFEGRFACIEHKFSQLESAIYCDDMIGFIEERLSKIEKRLSNIDPAMERILDILREHDDLIVPV